MVEIIPAIIPESFADVERDMRRVKGLVERVQIDVMDGKYTPEPSWPYNGVDADIFQELKSEKRGMPHWETLSFEVDLMVQEPEHHIADWIAAGAAACIFHFESTEVYGDIVARLRESGVGVGLALKPATPNEAIEPLISQVDFVQCMGNDRIGFHGVALDEAVVGKVARLREAHPELIIGIDIGVDEETVPRLAEVGVSRFASGSVIFGSNDIKETIRRFQNIAA